MNSAELLEKYKNVYIKNFLPLETCKFLTNILLRNKSIYPNITDTQVSDSYYLRHSDVGDTLLERMWDTVEEIVGEELIPTYSFARLYENGHVLPPHIDRPACEISLTIQLGRSHHYSYPIYMGDYRVDLAEGDAIVYKGREIQHYRNKCDGPENYYSGQIFLHYVKANGQYSDHGCDAHFRSIVKDMFVKNRSFLMDYK